VIDIVAVQEQLDILRQGVEIWNAWREKHPYVIPLLGGANLNGANLTNANLRHAELVDANLSGANLSFTELTCVNFGWATLSSADLNGADLNGADLSFANLSNASLSGAKLIGADLSHTILSNANLSGAYLRDANLSRTTLSGANLIGARVVSTIFGNLDLRTVKGLETLEHLGPSTIGTDTILRSEGDIPESFLRGAGLDDTFISYVLDLAKKPIQYNSCFISYSSKDQAFAKRLYADLQAKNVRCWYAPEHMKTGDRIRPRIYEQIWFNDKLLLVLSESSVMSKWVEYEVETAFARERKENRDILFPIWLDNAVIESTTAWAAHIQDARHITDFTRWKEHDEYQKDLNRLLHDLKQEAIKNKI
jgi:uncharacterized protein YjbI with pentapeptide repeats